MKGTVKFLLQLRMERKCLSTNQHSGMASGCMRMTRSPSKSRAAIEAQRQSTSEKSKLVHDTRGVPCAFF